MPKRLTIAAAIVDIFLDGTKVSFITSQSYHKWIPNSLPPLREVQNSVCGSTMLWLKHRSDL